MDSAKYREVLIGLDRALFVFHEAGNSSDEHDRSLENSIASIRRDVLRTWASHTAAAADTPTPAPTPVPEPRLATE